MRTVNRSGNKDGEESGTTWADLEIKQPTKPLE